MATLVTGAFGCIGAWVCRRLLEAGEKPVAFDRGDDPWRLRVILGPEHLRDVIMVKGDIADREKDGIRQTLDEFAALQKAGRLDARELEPAK